MSKLKIQDAQCSNRCKRIIQLRLWSLPRWGGGTLKFSHIRRLGLFLWVQNSEFQYFFEFSEK